MPFFPLCSSFSRTGSLVSDRPAESRCVLCSTMPVCICTDECMCQCAIATTRCLYLIYVCIFIYFYFCFYLNLNTQKKRQTWLLVLWALGLDPESVSGFTLTCPQAEDGDLIPDTDFGYAHNQPPILKWLASGEKGRKEVKLDEVKGKENGQGANEMNFCIWWDRTCLLV